MPTYDMVLAYDKVLAYRRGTRLTAQAYVGAGNEDDGLGGIRAQFLK